MKRDILRRIILELLTKDDLNYTVLEKQVCAISHQFITINTFKLQLRYLLENGFVYRVSRGVYKISVKGKKYLDIYGFEK